MISTDPVDLQLQRRFDIWHKKLDDLKYLFIAKILAKVKHKEQKLQRARMTQKRDAKAQPLRLPMSKRRRNSTPHVACDANLHAWQN